MLGLSVTWQISILIAWAIIGGAVCIGGYKKSKRNLRNKLNAMIEIVKNCKMEYNENLRVYYTSENKNLRDILFSYGKLIMAIHNIKHLGVDIRIVDSLSEGLELGVIENAERINGTIIPFKEEKAIKKPVTIDATQWFKNGDHPQDKCIKNDKGEPESEGSIVRYYRNPIGDGNEFCQYCKNPMHVHGWIDTLEGGHIVCPGDWIITGVKGEHYPCKPDIFKMTYDIVEGDEKVSSKILCTNDYCESKGKAEMHQIGVETRSNEIKKTYWCQKCGVKVERIEPR